MGLQADSGTADARLLPGSLQVITQAALAEFRQGNRERGRSLFEGVLRNYPRRLDLWSVYLDQVLRHPCSAWCGTPPVQFVTHSRPCAPWGGAQGGSGICADRVLMFSGWP